MPCQRMTTRNDEVTLTRYYGMEFDLSRQLATGDDTEVNLVASNEIQSLLWNVRCGPCITGDTWYFTRWTNVILYLFMYPFDVEPPCNSPAEAPSKLLPSCFGYPTKSPLGGGLIIHPHSLPHRRITETLVVGSNKPPIPSYCCNPRGSVKHTWAERPIEPILSRRALGAKFYASAGDVTIGPELSECVINGPTRPTPRMPA